jgi:prepilin-type N-terminal cleavage/methylation domain-containing protein
MWGEVFIMKRKLLKKVKKGFSLVEVLVAIAISAIALTSAAIFSARLMSRGQMNFLDQSALQLQALVTEQVRFLEFSMKNSLAENDGNYPASLSNPSMTQDVWKDSVCETGLATTNSYEIENFQFDTNSANTFDFVISEGTADTSNIPGEYNQSARFHSIVSYTDRIGILEVGSGSGSNKMSIAITSIFDGNIGDLESASITFEIGVKYSTLNEQITYDFTRPMYVVVNYSDVCEI